jgi:hypothetical protein
MTTITNQTAILQTLLKHHDNVSWFSGSITAYNESSINPTTLRQWVQEARHEETLARNLYTIALKSINQDLLTKFTTATRHFKINLLQTGQYPQNELTMKAQKLALQFLIKQASAAKQNAHPPLFPGKTPQSHYPTIFPNHRVALRSEGAVDFG